MSSDKLVINVASKAGKFAENKDIARDLRRQKIEPAIAGGKEVIIDFEAIEGATQSFVHALISDLIRTHGSMVLDLIFFKNCSEEVRGIINIVVDYTQQSD